MASVSSGGMLRLRVPPAACDTHIHVYDARYPIAPTAIGKPPEASAEAYRVVMQRLGLQRAVIVQPSAYGTDNRCTLAGMVTLGLQQTRGIAVVDEKVTEAALETLTAGGMRGARLHMLPGGAIPWHMADAVATRVQAVGWHVQLQLDGRLLPEREAQIRTWPGRIVIDHVGKFLAPVSPDHAAFRCLLRLVDSGRVWVKLSAPYEVSKAGPPLYDDVGRLAKLLVKAAPERMLWASNWPHPSVADKPDDGMLLDLLQEWAPGEADKKRILVDNPAEFYGF